MGFGVAAVLVPDREPVQFHAVHFLLMLSRNFGQNELDCSVNLCCSGDDVSKWKLRVEDHFYISSKDDFCLVCSDRFFPELALGWRSHRRMSAQKCSLIVRRLQFF